MPNLTTATVYVPQPDNAIDAEKWDIVAAALRAAGVTDIRRPPPPAQSYQPRHARPVLLSSAEI
jgi:hypothetical protein